MATHDVLFQPLEIKSVLIPNRFMSTSHQPGEFEERGRGMNPSLTIHGICNYRS